VEKIYFKNLDKHKYFHISLLLLAILLIFLGLFKIIHFQNPEINNYLKTTGQIIITFYLFYISGFFYKNSVHWNRLGMNIRLKRFSAGTDIKFNNVDKVQLQDSELVIYKKGKEKRIDLSKIRQEDREKLLRIILEHIED